MSSKPFGSIQRLFDSVFSMNDYEQMFSQVRNSVGLYLPGKSFAEAAAMIMGIDMAMNGEALRGFREWLVPRIGDGMNLSWSALVARIAFPEEPNPLESPLFVSSNEPAVQLLFQQLQMFLKRRSEIGLAGINTEYERWVSSHLSE